MGGGERTGAGRGRQRGHNTGRQYRENTMATQDGVEAQSAVHEITQNSQNTRTTSATGVQNGEAKWQEQETQEGSRQR